MNEDEKRWAEEYTDIVVSGMPDTMNDTNLIRIVGSLITAYKPDHAAATALMVHIMGLITQYYAAVETDGECMCPECIRERKSSAH